PGRGPGPVPAVPRAHVLVVGRATGRPADARDGTSPPPSAAPPGVPCARTVAHRPRKIADTAEVDTAEVDTAAVARAGQRCTAAAAVAQPIARRTRADRREPYRSGGPGEGHRG
ncbi:hypothetical protein, partial [Streptomyces griseiscabiei]|uniref:hypothetical protein n=1 Tax=Streptomyces griseiscabiei TaxID=2993540 RepID=UPI001C4E378C